MNPSPSRPSGLRARRGGELARHAYSAAANANFSSGNSPHPAGSQRESDAFCELSERKPERRAELGAGHASSAAGCAETFDDCREKRQGTAGRIRTVARPPSDFLPKSAGPLAELALAPGRLRRLSHVMDERTYRRNSGSHPAIPLLPSGALAGRFARLPCCLHFLPALPTLYACNTPSATYPTVWTPRFAAPPVSRAKA